MGHGRRLTIPLVLGAAAWLAITGCGQSQSTQDAGFDAGEDAGIEQDIVCTDINQCPLGHLCLEGICRPGTHCTGPADCPAGTQCAVLKEVCIPENPCAGDEDCQDPTPVCLTGSGLCVECKQKEDCPNGYLCGEDYQCEPEGPACTQDDDCTEAGKTHCDTHSGTCVACTLNEHCGSFVCEPSLHQCVECLVEADCEDPRPKCLVASHTCVECLVNTDCDGELRCNQTSHVCTAIDCKGDADCLNEAGRPKCDLATGDCVECLAHADCGAYGFCREMACSTDCVADAECQQKLGADYRCKLETGDCFQAECLGDADCAAKPATPHCKTVATATGPAQYTCVACLEDAHCPEHFECGASTATCRPMPCYRFENPDAECQAISACYTCDDKTGSCAPHQTCSFPGGTECCTGYTCESYGCEIDLTCSAQDTTCPAGYQCNTTKGECQWTTCCNPKCTAPSTCNESTCQCVNECHKQLEPCGANEPPCCEGFRCPALWPFCTPA